MIPFNFLHSTDLHVTELGLPNTCMCQRRTRIRWGANSLVANSEWGEISGYLRTVLQVRAVKGDNKPCRCIFVQKAFLPGLFLGDGRILVIVSLLGSYGLKI